MRGARSSNESKSSFLFLTKALATPLSQIEETVLEQRHASTKNCVLARQLLLYKIIDVDERQRRATLRRMAVGKIMPTQFSFDRLCVVDNKLVERKGEPSDDPTVFVWRGVSSTQLLLPAERKAVEKNINRPAFNSNGAPTELATSKRTRDIVTALFFHRKR